MSAAQLFRVSPLTASLAIALSAPASSLAANIEHTKETHIANDSEVIITVTAPATSPLEVASSLKTPRQPIPASDGSDYLKTIPGFSQIRNGGTNGDPVFRGMFGSRLRMLIDDSEILGSCGGRMDAPSSYISPESYDVLSLVKGPQTVLWGGGNSAGTIRFERTRPQFEQLGAQGNASTVIGSNGRWDGNADFSIGNELGYIRLIGNKSRSNDYKDGNGHRVPSRWDKWNTDIALGLTPDKNTLLEFSAGQGDGEARYAARGMDGSQFKRKSFGVRFEKSNIGEVFDKFESNFYYNYTDHVMDNYSLRTPLRMKMASEPDRLTMGGRMMGTWVWEDFKLQSGLDMQTNIHRSNTNHDMKKDKRMGWQKNARFRNYGLFGELTWDATEQSKVIGGARLDRATAYKYSTQQERKETLPAGFIRFEHNLKDAPVMFYAGVGHTERFPDYWEIFSKKAGENVFTNIKTEKTTQLDIGAQYNDNQLKGWVSAYVGKVNDFILFNYENENQDPAHNVNATIMGGETGLSYKFNENWKTDASLAYSWAQNTTNHRPLPQIPPLEARFGLTWEYGDWTSSGLLRLVNSQHRVAINEGNVVGKDFSSSKGFTILSANTAYQVTKNIQVSAGVDNIFNQAYSEHLNLAGNQGFGYSGNTAVNEPGRTYWARMNIKF